MGGFFGERTLNGTWRWGMRVFWVGLSSLLIPPGSFQKIFIKTALNGTRYRFSHLSVPHQDSPLIGWWFSSMMKVTWEVGVMRSVWGPCAFQGPQ